MIISDYDHSLIDSVHKIGLTFSNLNIRIVQGAGLKSDFELKVHINAQFQEIISLISIYVILQAFDEVVEICDEPLEKVCNDDIIGPEVCQTHYETTCETR